VGEVIIEEATLEEEVFVDVQDSDVGELDRGRTVELGRQERSKKILNSTRIWGLVGFGG
jgi:hypothetical protein